MLLLYRIFYCCLILFPTWFNSFSCWSFQANIFLMSLQMRLLSPMVNWSINVNVWHTVSLQQGLINSSWSGLFSYLSLYEPAGWWRPCSLEELWHSNLHFWFCGVQSMRHTPSMEVTPGLVWVYLCVMIHSVSSAFPGDGKADSRHGLGLPQAEDRLLSEVISANFTTHRSLSEWSWIFYHVVFDGKWSLMEPLYWVGWGCGVWQAEDI